MAKKNTITSDDFLNMMEEEDSFHSSYVTKNSSSLKSNITQPTESKKISEPRNSALDSRLLGVSPPLGSALDSRLLGVSPPLGKNGDNELGVSQALGTPLGKRPVGVRKKEKSALDISLLVGKEKQLLVIVCDECKRIGSLETNFISTEDLKTELSLDSNGVRNIIHRVKEKGFFDIESKQFGRVGLRKFKIRQVIYQQFLSSALDRHHLGVRQALGTALGTALEIGSSKLVSNNTLLTREESVPEFIQADISSLAELKISSKQLNDLANQKLNISLEQMENFIWKFERYATEPKNVRGVQNFAGLFCKLAQQLAVGTDPLANIKTPEDEAIEHQLQSAKRALAQQQALKDEHKTIQFQLWLNKLSKEDREKYAPPNLIVESGSELHDKALRGYFDQNIWK